MFRTIIFLLIVLVIVFGILVSFYKIEFNTEKCDILLRNRNGASSSYGINCKNGFKIWRFTNGANGLSAKQIYSLDNKTQPEEEIAPLPFKEGEELVYDVYSAGIMVGKSFLVFHGEEEYEGRRVFHITFSTELPFFKDYEEIYAEENTFLPLKVERRIEKFGGFYETIVEKYNQVDFIIDITKKSNFSSDAIAIRKYSPVYNAILLTYYCRANPEIAGKANFKITLPTADFDINMSGEETVNAPSGTYSTDVFSSTPPKFTFYLSKDKDRLPVKIVGHAALNYSMVLSSTGSSE